MDKPAMDFISLPDDCKVQIFKELNWKDLVNLKLVCRDFYFTIEGNIQALDRPKVHSLRMFCGKYRPINVEYILWNTEHIIFRPGARKNARFKNTFEYNNFLRDKSFTSVVRLAFNNIANTIVIKRFHSNLFSENHYKYHINITLSNRTSRLEPLSITISSTKKFLIPYNSNHLRRQCLRKWGLFKENGSILVMKKIIMDILTGNPFLEYNNTSTNSTKPFFIQISNLLYELGHFNPENRCNGGELKLSLRGAGEFTDLDDKFYRKFFGKMKFKYNTSLGKSGDKCRLIYNYLKCSKCGTDHINAIVNERFSEEKYILLI
uniref:F-box domain-containing protein n=1 Tax=Strongyloides papillosus TaxID=174720 RepID=A0A0N5BKI6_STREA